MAHSIPAPDPRTAVHRSIAAPPVNPDFDGLVATAPVAEPPRVPVWATLAGMCLALLAGMLIG
jgi:hypothetical protein